MEFKELNIMLSEYGLSENEIKAYIGLLRFGPSTIIHLSNRIRMNRSTAHISVEELIKKGLVSQTKYGERRLVVPESPEKLTLLLESERLNLERKEKFLPTVIDNVYDLISNAKNSTESVVKYIEGQKSVAKLYDSILDSKEIRAYYNFRALTTLFPENKDKFYEAGLKGVKIWDIITSDNKVDYIANLKMYKETPSVKFKLLPSNIAINYMDYLIYDGKISIIYFDSQPKAIVIDNILLYENAKVLFDLLWGFLS